MFYILYRDTDFEYIDEKILPEWEQEEVNLLAYTEGISVNGDDILLCCLNDEDLRKFLPLASKNEWNVAILTHPENNNTSKGLGLTTNLKDIIEEVLNPEIQADLDILYCNSVPVFQSVNIGNVFILTKPEKKYNFLNEFLTFLGNIRKVGTLKHRKFQISCDDEKIISTSALGMVAVENKESSVISKRLITDTSMNDGKFHLLILSPQNIMELLWFLFLSVLPNHRKLNSLPEFVGQIESSNLTIENETPIEFTVDNHKNTAEKIDLYIDRNALHLVQSSKFIQEDKSGSDKKSLKIDKLPTGQKREELTARSIPILPRATTEEFQELFKVLRENAKLTSAFVVMMILSTLIATFGLFGDSSPVIIGAMILAPIISPIVSFSMGMVRYDTNMLKTGIITILIGTLMALFFAAAVAMIIPLRVLTSEIEARLTPNLLDMGIAVASGVAAAYAHAKEGIAKSLAGVAIAVALVPPLAVAGIGIGWWNWEVFSGAILLYLTNLAGIIMFAGITFLFLGFAPFKRARMGLVYTFVIIALVAIPLTLSYNRIIKQANITQQLEGKVFDEAIIKDVKVRIGNPVFVSLKLVSPEAVKSEQIRNIKSQIQLKIGEPVILEVISATEF